MMMVVMMMYLPTHRVTKLWPAPPVKNPPVKIIVSPASGIPHAKYPLCLKSKPGPTVKKYETYFVLFQ